MRKISVEIAIVILAVGGAMFAFSQSAGGQPGTQAIDKIMAQIRSELKLGPNDRVDPSQVPKALMVELGDAVMDVMIPNEQQHQFMDQMMGGDGSASLDSMHSWIAYRYLTSGYSANGSGYGIMGYGMMSGGMMGYGNGRWGMMGNPNLPYDQIPWQSPEAIARQRYAQGQITRDQYEQIMKDLQQSRGNGTN